MKKNIKKLIQCFAAAAMLFFFVCDSTAYAAFGGSCGENVSFSLEDGTLTISGSGAMEKYIEPKDVPWYYNREEITAVVVEEGVTSISDVAFYEYTSLYSAQIANTVETIGEYAFAGCTKLENITMPENLQTIGQRAFENCESVKYLKIPSGTKFIGEGAFYRCLSLTGITVPQSVEYIGHAMLAYCRSLVSADFKCEITSVPVWMFYGCTSLTSVTFESQVETVGKYALQGCGRLNDITYAGEQQDVEQIKKDTMSTAPVIENDETDKKDVQETEDSVITIITPNQKEENKENTGVGTDENTDKNTDGNTDEKTDVETVQPSAVDIVIENDKGVKEAVTVLEKISQKSENVDVTEDTDVVIQLKNGNILKKDLLKAVAGKNITLTVVTTQGSKWFFDCRDITGKKFKDWDLSYTMTLKGGLSSTEYNIFGLAKCYDLDFADDFAYDVNLYLPAGANMARKYAGLCITDKTIENLGSVIIDDNNMACFAFAAGSTGEGYVFAVDVQNETASQEAYIPQHLQGEYTGLVDENGTRYVVTGRQSRWGIGIGEFTRYVVVFFIAVVIIVGSVTYVVIKQKQIKEKYRM